MRFIGKGSHCCCKENMPSHLNSIPNTLNSPRSPGFVDFNSFMLMQKRHSKKESGSPIFKPNATEIYSPKYRDSMKST